MEPDITLKSIIILLGAAHGLFLALALINVRRGSTIAHRLLALLTLTFAADLGVAFLEQSRYLLQFPKLVCIEMVTSFLYGPLIYLYVSALTSRAGFQFSSRKWWHFLPFVMSIVLLIPFYALSDSQIVELIYFDADIEYMSVLTIIGVLIVQFLPAPLIGIYLILSVRQLIRHSRDIRDQFSSIERISLTWLRNLLIALGMLYLFYLFALFFAGLFGVDEEVDDLFYLMVVIVIYTMGYLGLRQPVIFSRKKISSASIAKPFKKSIESSAQPEWKKYQKSALDAEMSSALLQELQHYMATEKPYLDSTLTLSQLAEQNRISSNYLSQIINEQTGNNFFDYINQHRVEAAKQLLADPARAEASVFTIAMDAGFNSKSAFYTAFKQHTNVTPSQFRKSLTVF